jgi:type II secretory pathway pseudopilin PulG
MINLFRFFKKRKKKGFGALELLVILAVFSLIVAFALSWVTSNKAKGRDSKRTSELNALRDALQLYYTDHGHYPTSTANEGEWCHIEAEPEDEAQGYNYCEGLYSEGEFVLSPYIKEVEDPTFKHEAPAGKIWSYRYLTTSSGMGYKLHTDLETKDEYEIVSGGWFAGDVNPPQPPPPPPPINNVHFSMSNFGTSEGEDTFNVKVSLSSPSSKVVKVKYRIKPGGDATQGSDFILGGHGTLIFTPGEIENSFPVRIIDDDMTEYSETVNFELYDPTNIEIGPPKETTLTIKDNDFWVKGYGNNSWSNAYSIAASLNKKEYVVLSHMYKDSNKGVAFLKVDINGNQLWLKYASSSEITDPDYRGKQKIIGDLYHDEYVAVASDDDNNSFILKIDGEGNQVWSETFSNLVLNDVANTGDGYIVVGRNYSPFYPIVAKFNRNGKLQWVKKYESAANSFNSIRETKGGYIIGGNYSGQASVIKIDRWGNVFWARRFGETGTDIQAIRSISDMGYVVSGGTTGYSATDSLGFIAELDSSGRTEWLKTYVLGDTSYDWFDIEETSDMGYVVSGKFDPPGGYCNGTILKTDGDGNQQWMTATWGDVCNMLYSVDEIFDGGYVSTGMNASWSTHSGHDYYILRTNQKGTVVSCPVCTEIDYDVMKDEVVGDISSSYSVSASDISLSANDSPIQLLDMEEDIKYDLCPED